MPGLYRSASNQQVYYVPADFEKDAPIHREGLVPFNINDENDRDVKHFFLWLHPSKSLDFLSSLQNGTAQFGKGDDHRSLRKWATAWDVRI